MTIGRKSLQGLGILAAVLVPLAINPVGYNGFELPKAVLLRFLALLVVVLLILQLFGARTFNRSSIIVVLKLPLARSVGFFGLSLVLATAISANPHESVWGTYDRQLGLLTLGACLVLFFSTAASVRGRLDLDRLWLALVWGSAPVVAYGTIQVLGFDPLRWSADDALPVFSTLGRSNFLASYLVLVLPLTVARASVGRKPWAYLPLVGGQLLCLAATEALAAWLGVVVATLAVLPLAARLTARHWKIDQRLRPARIIATIFLVLLVVLSATSLLGSVSGQSRLSAPLDFTGGSTAARLTIWQSVLPLISERPWLGYGPESLARIFPSVFPPQLVYYVGRHVPVDRAHNLWLDLALTAGIAGVIGFGLVVVSFGRLAWSALRRSSDRWSQAAWAGTSAGVLGHLVDLQFSFETIATSTIFWLLLAFGVGLHQLGRRPVPLSPEPPAVIVRRPSLGVLLPGLPPALAALWLGTLLCLRPLLADGAFFRLHSADASLTERYKAGYDAVRLWPLEKEYRVGLATLEGRLGNLEASELQFAAAGRLSPDDSRLLALQGKVYAAWGMTDPTRFPRAQAAYKRAIELAPHLATYYTALGVLLARQGQVPAGVGQLERAIELDTTDVTAYSHLAELYQALGREKDAERAYEQAIYWTNRARSVGRTETGGG